MYRHFVKLFLICLVSVVVSKVSASEDISAGPPYMVQLNYNDDNFKCMGILVTPEHVLTTGRCAETQLSYTAIGGTNNVKQKVFNNFQQDNDEYGWNSIAVLELKNKMEGTGIETLPLDKLSAQVPAAGAVIQILGFPAEGNYYSKIPNTMLDVTVKSDEECIRRGTNKRGQFIVDRFGPSMMCAVDQPKPYGRCRSTNGSPVMSNGKVFGLVTDDDSCGTPLPTYIIKFDQTQRDFIENTIKKATPLATKSPGKSCYGCVDNRGRWNGKPLFLPNDECSHCFN